MHFICSSQHSHAQKNIYYIYTNVTSFKYFINIIIIITLFIHNNCAISAKRIRSNGGENILVLPNWILIFAAHTPTEGFSPESREYRDVRIPYVKIKRFLFISLTGARKTAAAAAAVSIGQTPVLIQTNAAPDYYFNLQHRASARASSRRSLIATFLPPLLRLSVAQQRNYYFENPRAEIRNIHSVNYT